MVQLDDWCAPKSDAVLASYRVRSGKLRVCEGHNNQPPITRARKTLALWTAAQAFPDISMMIVKSEDGISLAIRNGGIIVEGRKNLNIGLVQVSTRTLDAVPVEHDENALVVSKDRFRRTFRTILKRLNRTVLSRAYSFRIGFVKGVVFAQNGELQFAGDFTCPSQFVQELKAACEVDDEIAYTFLEDSVAPDTEVYQIKDLISQVARVSDARAFIFDDNGWPLEWDGDATAETVQNLSTLAYAASQLKHRGRPFAVSLLSGGNQPVMTITVCKNKQIRVSLA